MHIFAKIAYW